MLINDFAKVTESTFPLIVINRSFEDDPLSPESFESSLFEIRIIAPEICRISAILEPPFPIMHPIKSLGIDIS
jgi:hypothetical protein